MAEGGNGSANQVEQDELEFSQHVFDIVAENPEIEHIPGQMQEAGMQEHRGIDGGVFRYGRMDQVIGNQSVLVEHDFREDGGIKKGCKIYPDICPDRQNGDEGEVFCRIFVMQGNHGLFHYIDGGGWNACDKILRY